MKKLKFITLTLAGAFVLSGCSMLPNLSSLLNSSSENGNSSKTSQQVYNNVNEAINAFVKPTGVTVPSLPSGHDYEWSVNSDSYGVYLVAYCTDNGTAGTNAVEDQYKAILEDAGWTCGNDSEYTYDDYGYIYDDAATYDDTLVELQFYTAEGEFDLYVTAVEYDESMISGSSTGGDDEDSDSESEELELISDVNSAMDNYAGLDVPNLPTSGFEYYGGAFETLFGDYYYVQAEDANNTLEDAYKTACEDAGWTCVNDEDYTYDDYGYLYDDESGEIEVEFYYEDGSFYLCIFASSGSAEETEYDEVSDPATVLSTYLGITVPSFPTGYTYYGAAISDDTYGDYYDLYCEDNGTIGTDAVEDLLKTILEDAGWTCTNDEEYTYDEYGYFYSYPLSSVEIQFYTYEGYFSLCAYLTE